VFNHTPLGLGLLLIAILTTLGLAAAFVDFATGHRRMRSLKT
jgi:hypothetical protein